MALRTRITKIIIIIILIQALTLSGGPLAKHISFSGTSLADSLSSGLTPYHSYNETVAELNQIATDHPDITKLISIGKSYEGRDIWAMKVSDNPDIEEDEPEIYYNGNHHAREWLTIEVCLYILNCLTDNYTINATITSIVDNRQIWVIPCVNPDGRMWDSDEDDPADHRNQPWGWRKNRRDNGDGSYGVDLNRNYEYMWGGAGASDITSEPTYRGPEPFSENETKTVRDFVMEHNFVFSISYHSYGQLILYPWGYTYNATEDDALFEVLANDMADLITNKAGSTYPGYTPAQGADLYMTSGSDDDWLYADLGIYAFTFELYPHKWDNDDNITSPYDRFHPNASKVLPVCEDNIEAALYLAKIADNPFQALDYHVSLSTDNNIELINQTETEAFTIQISNDGGNADTYDLSVSSIPGWTIDLDKSDISLNSESWGTASISVTVPSGESGGDYYIWVTATSQNDSFATDTLLFTVQVPYFHDVGIKSIDTFSDGGMYTAGQYEINTTVKNYGRTSEAGFKVSLEIIQLGSSVTKTVFSDDMESGVNGWQVMDLDGSSSPDSWKQVTSTFNSSTTSWWCGAAANYSNKTAQLLVSPKFDLTDATGANLTFYHKYNIEAAYDYGSVDVYNGAEWINLACYDGDSSSIFVPAKLSLLDFIDHNNLRIRFRFTTDEGVVDDGWFIDDVIIAAEFPIETVVYGPVFNQTSGLMLQDEVQQVSWDYFFIESGKYKIRTTTLLETDEYHSNNISYVRINIKSSLEKYTILKQGWNLISIPLIQEEQNITDVLSSIKGSYDIVEWYDATDINDHWKINKEGKPFGNDLTELNETKGFWVHITRPGDTIFLYNGTRPTENKTINLLPGWNMVGYPSLSPKNRTEALNKLTFDTHVDAIWTYNAAAHRWEEIEDGDLFFPGKGYWIHSKEKIVWEVPL